MIKRTREDVKNDIYEIMAIHFPHGVYAPHPVNATKSIMFCKLLELRYAYWCITTGYGHIFEHVKPNIMNRPKINFIKDKNGVSYQKFIHCEDGLI